jgi:hypothetical protein
MHGEFRNVVLEEVGDKLGSSVKHEVLQRVNEDRNVLYIVKRRKANWIGHILRRNCFLKHVI